MNMTRYPRLAVESAQTLRRQKDSQFIKWLEREGFTEEIHVSHGSCDSVAREWTYIDVDAMTWQWGRHVAGNGPRVGDAFITVKEFKAIWHILKHAWYRSNINTYSGFSRLHRFAHPIPGLEALAEKEVKSGRYKKDRFSEGEPFRYVLDGKEKSNC